MKSAYEWERELIENAIPQLVPEEDQTWNHAKISDDAEALKTALLWGSNVPGSGAPERVLLGGIQSMIMMGYDMSEAEALLADAVEARKNNDRVKLSMITARVFHLVNTAKKIPTHKYWTYKVYETYEEYAANSHFDVYPEVNTKSHEFLEKTHAGWLTQIIGAALGTAIEGYTSENIKKAYGEINDFPRKPNTYNDDITYELAMLEAFREKGYRVTSADIAEHWVGMIPDGWSAEDSALRNIRLGIYPPESGIRSNPWREWIGAQMRGAICGMLAPGDPREAARLAWVDGCVSHHNNGIMGEIFNAVMVSLAYVESDITTIVEKAMKAIPSDCEYYSVIQFAYDACKRHDEYMEAWLECEDKYKAYNWIHAYPNAAAEVVALMFCNDDFDTCLNHISMMGQDCDCNCAQIATLFGIIYGSGCIDRRWSDPIGDDLYSFVRRYEKLTITELAQRTVDAVNNAKNSR